MTMWLVWVQRVSKLWLVVLGSQLMGSLMRHITKSYWKLGCTSLVKHTIDTFNNLQVKQQPYHTLMIYREQIAKMVEGMQVHVVVQPLSSPWANPVVVLVQQKDGTARFCIDYQRLNAVPEKTYIHCHKLKTFYQLADSRKQDCASNIRNVMLYCKVWLISEHAY